MVSRNRNLITTKPGYREKDGKRSQNIQGYSNFNDYTRINNMNLYRMKEPKP